MGNEIVKESEIGFYQNQLLKRGITKDQLDMCDYVGVSVKQLQKAVNDAIKLREFKENEMRSQELIKNSSAISYEKSTAPFAVKINSLCMQMEQLLKDNDCIPVEKQKKDGSFKQSLIECSVYKIGDMQMGSITFHHGGEGIRYTVQENGNSLDIVKESYNDHVYQGQKWEEIDEYLKSYNLTMNKSGTLEKVPHEIKEELVPVHEAFKDSVKKKDLEYEFYKSYKRIVEEKSPKNSMGKPCYYCCDYKTDNLDNVRADAGFILKRNDEHGCESYEIYLKQDEVCGMNYIGNDGDKEMINCQDDVQMMADDSRFGHFAYNAILFVPSDYGLSKQMQNDKKDIRQIILSELRSTYEDVTQEMVDKCLANVENEMAVATDISEINVSKIVQETVDEISQDKEENSKDEEEDYMFQSRFGKYS